MFVVGGLFHLLVPLVAPGIPPQFINVALFRPWKSWTSIYMAVHPFGYGIIFAGIYLALRRWCTFPPVIRGGLIYGAGVFIVGSFPVYALAFASFQVSIEVIAAWVLQSACQYISAGIAISALAGIAPVEKVDLQIDPGNLILQKDGVFL